jgi:hypothetical protein
MIAESSAGSALISLTVLWFAIGEISGYCSDYSIQRSGGRGVSPIAARRAGRPPTRLPGVSQKPQSATSTVWFG